MRRDHTTTPFDVEADDLTQEFWGSTRGWVSSEQPSTPRAAPGRRTAPRRRDDTTGSLRAIRDGFAALRPQTSPTATGQVERQRRHGAPAAPGAPRREATLGELAVGRAELGGWVDDDVDDVDAAWDRLGGHGPITDPVHRPDRSDDRAQRPRPEPATEIELTPVAPLAERLGLGAVDPLLLRAGAVLTALVLLVPIVLSLRPDRADSLPTAVVETPAPPAAGAAPLDLTVDQVPNAEAGAPTATVSDTTGSSAAAPAEPSAVAPTAGPAAEDLPSSSAEPTTPTGDASGADRTLVETAVNESTVADGASVDVAAERVVPACPQTYTAAAGDSWYRIADAAGISMTDLLAENTATTEAVILPGDEICLTADATVPSPPATTVPTTTEPESDAPTSTPVPTTTEPPTTTAAPQANLSRAEVQELIRQTWPADEVDTALAIARRESNFIATADNGWCCVGVFQIYWTVHRSWLDDFGIHERSDLFDARKNIAAAHHLWLRNGWGPWGG